MCGPLVRTRPIRRSGGHMQLFESVSRWFSDMPAVRRARNGQRVDVYEQVLLRAVGDDNTNLALLRDLSIGGACVRCDLSLSHGEMVYVRTNADTDDEFEFTACVVAVRLSDLGFFTDYGLRIVEMNIESAGALANFIARRMQTL